MRAWLRQRSVGNASSAQGTEAKLFLFPYIERGMPGDFFVRRLSKTEELIDPALRKLCLKSSLTAFGSCQGTFFLCRCRSAEQKRHTDQLADLLCNFLMLNLVPLRMQRYRSLNPIRLCARIPYRQSIPRNVQHEEENRAQQRASGASRSLRIPLQPGDVANILLGTWSENTYLSDMVG